MKIIKIQTGKLDNYGNYSFWLSIEGKSESYLLRQKAEVCQFKEGDEIPDEWEAKPEQYQNKNGEMVKYFVLKAPQKSWSGNQKSTYKAEPFEHKAAGYACAYVKDLVIAGKVDISELDSYFEHIYSLIISKKVNQ